MRCNKHFSDVSSAVGVGVCASCLRERLFTVIETQSKAAQSLVHTQMANECRKSDAIPPQIVFPRSVSPYISRRKSDNVHLQHSLSKQRFFSTPQLEPNGMILTQTSYKRRNGKFWRFSNLFRSKMQSFHLDSNFNSKSRKSNSSAAAKTTEASTASWFSSIFSSKQKEKSRIHTMSFPVAGRSDQRNRRGMSPRIESDDECGDGLSGYLSGSPGGWKETPQRKTPQARISGRRQNQPKNVARLVLCLSPLMRPSPSRTWNQKGTTPENTLPSGEIRVPAKPHLHGAAAFPGNRSRKLGNFGRFYPSY